MGFPWAIWLVGPSDTGSNGRVPSAGNREQARVKPAVGRPRWRDALGAALASHPPGEQLSRGGDVCGPFTDAAAVARIANADDADAPLGCHLDQAVDGVPADQVAERSATAEWVKDPAASTVGVAVGSVAPFAILETEAGSRTTPWEVWPMRSASTREAATWLAAGPRRRSEPGG